MKKIQLASILGLSITLFACGGSGSDPVVGDSGSGSSVDTSRELLIKKISGTSWLKECFPVSNYLTMSGKNYITIEMSINSSLKSITRAEVFNSIDATCNHHSIVKRFTFTTQLEITNKIMSEESIAAYGVNTTFVESPDITELPTSYSLIYHDSEKLFYGKASGTNLGKTKKTRHTSISLNDYFRKL